MKRSDIEKRLKKVLTLAKTQSWHEGYDTVATEFLTLQEAGAVESGVISSLDGETANSIDVALPDGDTLEVSVE